MGASFANLQVRVPGGVDPIPAVRAIFDRLLGAEGLVPSDGEADRSVLLARAGDWLAIYDEAGDTIAEGPGAFLEALSTVGPAISVLVHDSDVLLLELAVGGKVVDRWDSNPTFTGGRRTKPATHVRAWSAAFGVPESAMAPVFSTDETFAEAALGPLAAAIGAPLDRLGTGYRYLHADGAVPVDGVTLRYRLAVRPAAWQPYAGPPRLLTPEAQARAMGATIPSGRRPALEVGVGAELRASLTTRNAGGPATGLVVELEGPPWYEPRGVQLVLGNPLKLQERRTPVPTVAPVGADGRWSAKFADAAVPAGSPPPDPRAALRLGVEKLMDLHHAGQVHVNVIGVARAAGSGVLRIRLVPGGDAGGAAVDELPIAARDTSSERPLRAPPTVHPTQLAPLSSREHLVALVVGPDVPRLVQLAASLPAPAAPKVRWTQYRAGGKAPKLKTVASQGFLGAPFAKLAADVPERVGLLHAEWVDGAEAREAHGVIELGAGIIPSPRAVPALAFSVRGDADGHLREAIDRLAAEGTLIQAILTRWGHPAGLEFTPYEQACGVMGQCTLERPWVERWLRGVGVGAIWLGPALRRLVPDARGTPLGDAVRIDVTDVRAAEAALAAVLPGPDDWRQGIMARYR